MNEYNTRINIRTGANMKSSEGGTKLPKQYELRKDLYNDFVKKADSSDFKNAVTRYMTEFRYLNDLVKSAEQFGLQDELTELNKKLEDIRKIMEEKGVKLD